MTVTEDVAARITSVVTEALVTALKSTAVITEAQAAKLSSAVSGAVSTALMGTAKAESSPAERVAALRIGAFQDQASAAMVARLDAAQAAQAGLRGMPSTAESVRRRFAVAETTTAPAAAAAPAPKGAANGAARTSATEAGAEAARLAAEIILESYGIRAKHPGGTAAAVSAESASNELWDQRGQIWAGTMVGPHPAEAPAVAASASPPAEDAWENRSAVFNLMIPPSFGARPISSATVPA